MKTPRTPEHLANAIESLVASYIDEVHQAAQQGVERALFRRAGSAPGRRSKGGHRPPAATTATKRRTAGELDEVCGRLCALVRARPGESIVMLAEEMGEPAGALQRPMAKLRADGRVRTVGQRHLMRYFPTVVRTAPAKG
jgi:plasmid replication initiation protein